MRAGRLRHLVVLQRRDDTAAPNAFNEPADAWTDLATVWAAIEPISGREFFAAQQVQSEVSHRITIRYYAGLTTKDRVKFGERLFDIRAVLDRDERHVEMQLMCTEHA